VRFSVCDAGGFVSNASAARRKFRRPRPAIFRSVSGTLADQRHRLARLIHSRNLGVLRIHGRDLLRLPSRLRHQLRLWNRPRRTSRPRCPDPRRPEVPPALSRRSNRLLLAPSQIPPRPISRNRSFHPSLIRKESRSEFDYPAVVGLALQIDHDFGQRRFRKELHKILWLARLLLRRSNSSSDRAMTASFGATPKYFTR